MRMNVIFTKDPNIDMIENERKDLSFREVMEERKDGT
jgi:hypothetical protein